MCCAQKFERPMQRPACLQINTLSVFNYKNDFRSTLLGGSILSPKLRLRRFFLKYTDTYSSHECLEGRKILPEKGYHVCLFKQMYCVLRLSEPYRYSQTFLQFLLSQTNGRYSLCGPLWCHSLWWNLRFATGERERSRIQVQLKIKRFNISKYWSNWIEFLWFAWRHRKAEVIDYSQKVRT